MLLARRQILQGASAAAALSLWPSRAFTQATEAKARPVDLSRIHVPDRGRASRPLNLLMLGGTVFVGPAVVKAALARGHKVTLFNRGASNPGLFPKLEHIRGDRTIEGGRGMAGLRGRRFDAAIDTWALAPRGVDYAARALVNSVDRYLYVSTISVYDGGTWNRQQIVRENDPRRHARPGTRPSDPEIAYGVRKRMAEDYAADVFGDRLTIVRPHQILGYHIAQGLGQRYWPMRFTRGGDILMPGDGQDRIQFIDVGDLGAFIVKLIEDEQSGAYHALRTLSWADFAGELSQLSPTPPRLRWIAHDRLEEAGVRPFSNMPIWVPRQRGPGFAGHDSSRADHAGLTHRPSSGLWRDIVEGTAPLYPGGFSWAGGEGDPITPAREAELLARFAAA